MTTHACPTCQHEHEPDITVDMTGHDEALRDLLHKHATFLTAVGQAIEAKLAGETVEWPKPARNAENEFLTRYYPGEDSLLYPPTYSPRAYVYSHGGRKKTIWSAT